MAFGQGNGLRVRRTDVDWQLESCDVVDFATVSTGALSLFSRERRLRTLRTE